MRTIEKSLRSVEDIKADILNNVGSEIVIRESNKQGKQIKEYSGTILETYERLFLMKVRVGETSHFNRTFSYSELLTRSFAYEFLNGIEHDI